MWFTNLLSAIGGGISAVVDGWQKRATARTEAEVRTTVARAESEAQIALARGTAAARIAENTQVTDAAWDLQQASAMEHTWKDEWFVLLFSVPLILAFVYPAAVASGFASLEGMPSWYYYSLGTMISATFGTRRLLSLFESVRGARR